MPEKEPPPTARVRADHGQGEGGARGSRTADPRPARCSARSPAAPALEPRKERARGFSLRAFSLLPRPMRQDRQEPLRPARILPVPGPGNEAGDPPDMPSADCQEPQDCRVTRARKPLAAQALRACYGSPEGVPSDCPIFGSKWEYWSLKTHGNP
jgi:hypothetical protein